MKALIAGAVLVTVLSGCTSLSTQRTEWLCPYSDESYSNPDCQPIGSVEGVGDVRQGNKVSRVTPAATSERQRETQAVANLYPVASPISMPLRSKQRTHRVWIAPTAVNNVVWLEDQYAYWVEHGKWLLSE